MTLEKKPRLATTGRWWPTTAKPPVAGARGTVGSSVCWSGYTGSCYELCPDRVHERRRTWETLVRYVAWVEVGTSLRWSARVMAWRSSLWCPRQESNLCTHFAVPKPLSCDDADLPWLLTSAFGLLACTGWCLRWMVNSGLVGACGGPEMGAAPPPQLAGQAARRKSDRIGMTPASAKVLESPEVRTTVDVASRRLGVRRARGCPTATRMMAGVGSRAARALATRNRLPADALCPSIRRGPRLSAFCTSQWASVGARGGSSDDRPARAQHTACAACKGRLGLCTESHYQDR